jgi:hypothetical protein
LFEFSGMTGSHGRCDERFIGLKRGSRRWCERAGPVRLLMRYAIVKPSRRPVKRSSLQFARVVCPQNAGVNAAGALE